MTKERKFFYAKVGVTVILLGLLVFFLSRQWDELYQTFSKMNGIFFVIGAFTFFASNLTGYFVWLLAFLAMRVPVRKKEVFRVSMLGAFYNNLLLSSIGGDVVKVMEIHDDGIPTERVISAILIDRVTSLYALALSFLISFTFVLRDKALCTSFQTFIDNIAFLQRMGIRIPVLEYRGGIILFFYISLFAGTLLIGMFLYHERTYRFLVRVVNRVVPFEKVRKFFLTLLESFHMLKQKRRFTIIMIVFIFITQFLKIMVNYFVGTALNMGIEMQYYFLFVPIVGMVSILPLSINGIGIQEFVGGMLFANFIPGVAGASAIAKAASLMFTSRFANMAGNFLCGFSFFMKKPKKRKVITKKEKSPENGSPE